MQAAAHQPIMPGGRISASARRQYSWRLRASCTAPGLTCSLQLRREQRARGAWAERWSWSTHSLRTCSTALVVKSKAAAAPSVASTQSTMACLWASCTLPRCLCTSRALSCPARNGCTPGLAQAHRPCRRSRARPPQWRAGAWWPRCTPWPTGLSSPWQSQSASQQSPRRP